MDYAETGDRAYVRVVHTRAFFLTEFAFDSNTIENYIKIMQKMLEKSLPGKIVIILSSLSSRLYTFESSASHDLSFFNEKKKIEFEVMSATNVRDAGRLDVRTS